MSAAIYVLCALTSAACAIALFAMYWPHRRQATRLVLWSSVCFAWFAISNTLMALDFLLLADAQLAVARAATACIGASTLLFGLAWETW